jgi:hypothetical protein
MHDHDHGERSIQLDRGDEDVIVEQAGPAREFGTDATIMTHERCNVIDYYTDYSHKIAFGIRPENAAIRGALRLRELRYCTP